MYQLKIKLKQHTPILHFQHDQTGATLRATEVKPKLDRYLLLKEFENDKSKCSHLTHNHKRDNPTEKNGTAFSYKMKFVVEENFTGEIPENVNKALNGYFANREDKKSMYPKENFKHLTFARGISLLIGSRNKGLLEIIEKHIAGFFLNHNFGTRQSRGFGSFYIDENDSLYVNPELSYSFDVKVDRSDLYKQWKAVSEYIDLFARSLRAGLNLKDRDGTRFYFKSLAFIYAKDVLNAQWDKKTIKEQFFSGDLRDQQNTHNSDILTYKGNKLLIKDMFGLSSDESWRSYNTSIKKENLEKPVIQRFQSPLFFKPIKLSEDKYRVHFKANEVPKEMLNREFVITNKTTKKNFKIKTPEQFSMEDFLDHTLRNFEISEHVDHDYSGQREYEILESIFNDIINNIN